MPVLALQVAADNAAAVRLYQKCGYVAVKRTDRGACNCLASRVLNFFLVRADVPSSLSVWWRRQQPGRYRQAGRCCCLPCLGLSLFGALILPPLCHPAAGAQRVDQDAQAPASPRPPGGGPAGAAEHPGGHSQRRTGRRGAVRGCGIRGGPGGASDPARRCAHGLLWPAAGDSETGMAAPPAPGIHASSLLRKLSNGAGVLGAAPASQGPTPRIGAVPAAGFGAPSGAGAAQPPTYDRASSLKEGGGYTQLDLRAMPTSSEGGAAHTEPAKLFMAAGVGAPSSASVTSIDSDSDSDADGEALRPACSRPLLLRECLLQVLPAVGMLPLILHAPCARFCRPCRHLRRPGWGCLCDHASARGQPACPRLNHKRMSVRTER